MFKKQKKINFSADLSVNSDESAFVNKKKIENAGCIILPQAYSFGFFEKNNTTLCNYYLKSSSDNIHIIGTLLKELFETDLWLCESYINDPSNSVVYFTCSKPQQIVFCSIRKIAKNIFVENILCEKD